MSRSWINGTSATAGLVIGRHTIGMAEISHENDKRRVIQLTEATLPVPLFTGSPNSEATNALAATIKRIAPNLANRYLPVHVSLPDPLVRTAVFDLDELPPTRGAQIDLARWRFSREWGVEATQVCTCQPLGGDSGKPLLFALSLDTHWQQCVTDALRQAGVVPWSLSSNSCRQFNHFHDRLVDNGSALVTISADTWALWLCDANGRPRYVRSRWREANDNDADIASDIERSILAYVHGAPERSVSQVYVAAADREASLIAALNSRLNDVCVRLIAADGLTFESEVDSSLPTAFSSLAAALDS